MVKIHVEHLPYFKSLLICHKREKIKRQEVGLGLGEGVKDKERERGGGQRE